ncbi:MAG TPA: DUF4157 domain-containing protein [Kofleriaceae bacterium]|nr:DUF4157 domain-containing protein [Kofleriaceae bacterium]
MLDSAGKQSRTASAGVANEPAGPSPGKQTRVEAAAARGTATPATALPHGAQIQKAFGRHDISGVQAHTGAGARESADAMGAQAFATGNHVVLGQGTDLHTVAHEAAHVVQQRGGVQCKGGVGAEGDEHERHADLVADHVVQGKSAEGLLDRYAGAGAAAASTGPVQRKVTVGASALTPKTDQSANIELASRGDVETAWQQIQHLPAVQGVDEASAKAVLMRWVLRPVPDKHNPDTSIQSEDRKYRTWDELAAAVAGEVSSSPNLAHEDRLAVQTLSAEAIASGVGSFTARLLTFHQTHAALAEGEQTRGRYAGWTYGQQGDTIGQTLQAPPADVQGRIAFIADYALAQRHRAFEVTGSNKKTWSDTMALGVTPELAAGRATHHNTDEGAPWVQQARAKQSPLSAGPSATTAQVLTLAVAVQATVDEKTALAWALFGIWNTMPTHMSGTHRFHEVMAVAKGYGVPYNDFEYSEPPAKK